MRTRAFLWPRKIPCRGWTASVSVCSATDGHLGGSPLVAAMTCAAVNTCAKVFEHLLSVVLGTPLAVDLLAHVLIPC